MKNSILFVTLFAVGVFLSGCTDPVERVQPVLVLTKGVTQIKVDSMFSDWMVQLTVNCLLFL